MIGHELTVLHDLDHAQTLAIVLPDMLRTQGIEASQAAVIRRTRVEPARGKRKYPYRRCHRETARFNRKVLELAV